MKKPHAPAIREFLRRYPEGRTINQIIEAVPAISKAAVARNALQAMPDVYIDRWVLPIRGQYQAVYCAVEVPRNCPYPTDRAQFVKTEWRRGRWDARVWM